MLQIVLMKTLASDSLGRMFEIKNPFKLPLRVVLTLFQLLSMVMLVPPEVNCPTKEQGYEQNAV